MGGCLSKTVDTECEKHNGTSAGQALSQKEKEQRQEVTLLPQQHRSAVATADFATAKPTNGEAATVLCSLADDAAAAPPASTAAVAASPVLVGGVFSSADVSPTPVFEAKVMQRVSATVSLALYLPQLLLPCIGV
jgi:hypothetical protein